MVSSGGQKLIRLQTFGIQSAFKLIQLGQQVLKSKGADQFLGELANGYNVGLRLPPRIRY